MFEPVACRLVGKRVQFRPCINDVVQLPYFSPCIAGIAGIKLHTITTALHRDVVQTVFYLQFY